MDFIVNSEVSHRRAITADLAAKIDQLERKYGRQKPSPKATEQNDHFRALHPDLMPAIVLIFHRK